MVLVTTTRYAGLHLRDVVRARRHQAGQRGQEPAHPRVGPGVLHDVDPVARIRPSLVPPIVTDCRWARPCVIPTRFSLRVSVQRTARPVRLAAQATAITSRSMPTLAPNPPPTSGVITRIAARVQAQHPGQDEPGDLRVLRAHPDGQLAVRPARAATARPSIGTGASRWLMMVLADHHVTAVEARRCRRRARPSRPPRSSRSRGTAACRSPPPRRTRPPRAAARSPR